MLLKQLNSLEATKERKKTLNFYIVAAQHLQKKLSLDSQNLKDPVALHPRSRQPKFYLKTVAHGLQDSFHMSFKEMKLHVSMMSGKLAKVNQYLQIGMKQVNFLSCFYVFFFLTLTI